LPAAPTDASAHCEALLRAADKDRFLATLFAPADRRGALHALYAFNAEIARVRELIHEPLAGEIRLQWWSDALAGKASGSLEGNPVAAALVATVARHQLPAQLLDGLIAARRFDLYDDPMRSRADLNDYARATSSSLIELAARILTDVEMPGLGEVALHAGIAHAIARLLQAFPIHTARGQLFLPLDLLERHGVRRGELRSQQSAIGLRAAMAELRGTAREHLKQAGPLAAQLPEAALPALLPVALARPLLDRMERKDYDPFAGVDLAQWRRQWLFWRAAARPPRIFN
jgi:phytoene synthase